jgi:nicotinate dehydrogenase subunit B
METSFRLTVNGTEHTVRCEPGTPLLDVLRHDLGLTGPRFGCGIGQCGTCCVLVGGRARASCDLPVSAVAGTVTTVEGLADGEGLHPVQQAFIDEQAAQCGYCTSGMVVATVGLLREYPAPTEEQVREALDGHLCRCGTQGRIVRAVLHATTPVPAGQAVSRRPPAWEVLASQVPAGDTRPGEGVTLAPPPAPAAMDVAESGVRSSTSALPADLAANPVLSQWLDFSRDGEVTISTGKVEYGQGIWTALAQVAAEELQVNLARVRVAPVSTAASPNEGITAGSLSVQDSGAAIRQACAQARELLLDAAADGLGVARGALDVADGRILTGDRPTGLSYWALARPGLLDRPADGRAMPRPPSEWSVAGSSEPRFDIPDKVTGRPRFLHDMVMPGMAYGRVVRPPARAAALTRLVDPNLDREVVLVRDGSFLGVLARSDRAARLAAERVAHAARSGRRARIPSLSARESGAGDRAAAESGRTQGHPNSDGRVHPAVPRPCVARAQLRDRPLGG